MYYKPNYYEQFCEQKAFWSFHFCPPTQCMCCTVACDLELCAKWNLYIPPNPSSIKHLSRRNTNEGHPFLWSVSRKASHDLKCSAPQSPSTYQIQSGTETERKASISWSAVPETAPCPDFTLAFCDWGHTVMYFLGVVTPSYEQSKCMCIPFFLVFTLCCWLCDRSVCFKFNNTVPQTDKYTVSYITCTCTQSVCQTWCRGLAFSCKNTPANWSMHQTTFTRALNSRRADAEHKAAIVIKSNLTCSCHSRWPPFQSERESQSRYLHRNQNKPRKAS